MERHAAAIETWYRRAMDAGGEIWHDPPARYAGLAIVGFLWLAVALTELAFLPLAAASVAVLRFRLRHRPVERFDDWL
jgi:hypothetical protein